MAAINPGEEGYRLVVAVFICTVLIDKISVRLSILLSVKYDIIYVYIIYGNFPELKNNNIGFNPP